MSNRIIITTILFCVLSSTAIADGKKAIEKSKSYVGNPAIASKLELLSSQLQDLQEQNALVLEQISNQLEDIRQASESSMQKAIDTISTRLIEQTSTLHLAVGNPYAPVSNEQDLTVLAPINTQCVIKDDDRLLVQVSNWSATENTPEFTLRVNFFVGSELIPYDIVITQPLPPTASRQFLFDFPSGCFSADCKYNVVADPDDLIEEFNEDNNSIGGNCLG